MNTQVYGFSTETCPLPGLNVVMKALEGHFPRNSHCTAIHAA